VRLGGRGGALAAAAAALIQTMRGLSRAGVVSSAVSGCFVGSAEAPHGKR
jgi:hypothetical protein